jgi:uncharacterized protein YbjT (DUF2867 family)
VPYGYFYQSDVKDLCFNKRIENMNIVITGSIGNIGKPLTETLVKDGHSVTVISSDEKRKEAIEALGAEAAIGSIDDVDFLTKTFTGADAVYTMLPPYKFEENPSLDPRDEARMRATNYIAAIHHSGVKKVVHLSSVGAHTETGNGLLAFHFYAEQVLLQLPSDVAITFMRPTGFYYNLYQFIGMIKGQGLIASNYGADDTIPWVSPVDIAAAIAEELTTSSTGRKVRYVASEVLSCNEIAATIGAAIDKPDLKWITISDEQMRDTLLQFHLPLSLANDIVEMNASMHTGKVYEDYNMHKPALGKVKMTDFAEEFAVVYNSK